VAANPRYYRAFSRELGISSEYRDADTGLLGPFPGLCLRAFGAGTVWLPDFPASRDFFSECIRSFDEMHARTAGNPRAIRMQGDRIIGVKQGILGNIVALTASDSLSRNGFAPSPELLPAIL
jgi:hypothetical protein